MKSDVDITGLASSAAHGAKAVRLSSKALKGGKAVYAVKIPKKALKTASVKALMKKAAKRGSNGIASFGKNTVGAAERYLPSNIKMVEDKFLKKNGIDAHALKEDFIGKKNIAHYDIYTDKDTGMLWIYRKGGKGEPIPTYEYIKGK